MKRNQWFAVRCCCTPTKVFGFIKMTAPEPGAIFPVGRTVVDTDGGMHHVSLLSLYDRRRPDFFCSEYRGNPADLIESTLIEPNLPEIAIYSDDRPIEFWRTIQGFVEVPPTN